MASASAGATADVAGSDCTQAVVDRLLLLEILNESLKRDLEIFSHFFGGKTEMKIGSELPVRHVTLLVSDSENLSEFG
jgi:hypothetical protein